MRGLALSVMVGLTVATSASALEVGQKAPNFTLDAPGGKKVQLTDLLSRGPVVLYTLIQAFTKT